MLARLPISGSAGSRTALAPLLEVGMTLQVDTVVGQAQQVYQSNTSYLQQQLEKQKQFHAANLESYRAAREQYLKKVSQA